MAKKKDCGYCGNLGVIGTGGCPSCGRKKRVGAKRAPQAPRAVRVVAGVDLAQHEAALCETFQVARGRPGPGRRPRPLTPADRRGVMSVAVSAARIAVGAHTHAAASMVNAELHKALEKLMREASKRNLDDAEVIEVIRRMPPRWSSGLKCAAEELSCLMLINVLRANAATKGNT